MRRFTRPPICFALLLAPVLALAAIAPAFAAPVAVVAAVKGRVQVTSPQSRVAVRVTFGRPLERGDRVTVGAGGSATLFFDDGNVVELSERSSLTIGGRVAANPRAALPGEVFAQVSRFATAGSRETGLVAIAGMRTGEDASTPLLLAPRRTSLLTDAPALAWRAVNGATRYRVRVLDAAGAELWSREVPAGDPGTAPALAYPADAPRLTADRDLQWEVEALGASGTLRRESTTMRVVTPAAGADVRANLDRITAGAGGAGAPAAHFLAGSYLSGLGLRQDAAEQFRALATLAPESPGPHEALGQLYLTVGLADLAAAEFQQALALQRDAH